MDAQVRWMLNSAPPEQHEAGDAGAAGLVLAASAAGATLPTADSHRPHTLTCLIRRMDEAYEAAVEKLGGLEQCKPKAVLLQLQVGGTSRRRSRAASLRRSAERDAKPADVLRPHACVVNLVLQPRTPNRSAAPGSPIYPSFPLAPGCRATSPSSLPMWMCSESSGSCCRTGGGSSGTAPWHRRALRRPPSGAAGGRTGADWGLTRLALRAMHSRRWCVLAVAVPCPPWLTYKPFRRSWLPLRRLEEAYEEAVTQLGGIHSAQPKQVLERLQPEFPDLTLEVRTSRQPSLDQRAAKFGSSRQPSLDQRAAKFGPAASQAWRVAGSRCEPSTPRAIGQAAVLTVCVHCPILLPCRSSSGALRGGRQGGLGKCNGEWST